MKDEIGLNSETYDLLNDWYNSKAFSYVHTDELVLVFIRYGESSRIEHRFLSVNQFVMGNVIDVRY